MLLAYFPVRIYLLSSPLPGILLCSSPNISGGVAPREISRLNVRDWAFDCRSSFSRASTGWQKGELSHVKAVLSHFTGGIRNFLVLLAIATIFMIFSTKELIGSIFLHPPEAQVSALRLFVLKEAGGSC